MTFVQPYFWATGYRRSVAPHAVSVLFTAPTWEPLTLAEAKQRAGIDGEGVNALLVGFIAAARAKVEQDTGLALPTQTRDVYLDAVHGSVIQLPPQSLPLQSVTSVKSTDTAGVVNTLATTQYVVDLAGGRIALSQTGAWPTDLARFQPWVIRIVSGWTSAELIPPLLVHAVGLLVAHYATLGRDLASLDPTSEVPFGYEDAIAPYRSVVVV